MEPEILAMEATRVEWNWYRCLTRRAYVSIFYHQHHHFLYSLYNISPLATWNSSLVYMTSTGVERKRRGRETRTTNKTYVQKTVTTDQRFKKCNKTLA